MLRRIEALRKDGLSWQGIAERLHARLNGRPLGWRRIQALCRNAETVRQRGKPGRPKKIHRVD